jgi:DNA-binding transcriptional MocR family regulator
MRRHGRTEYVYQGIARRLETQILRGTLQVGVRLPSLRTLAAQEGVSVLTAHQAYVTLEDRGLIEARSRSGFYVAAERGRPAAPALSNVEPSAPAPIATADLIADVVGAVLDARLTTLAAAVPAPHLLPSNQINRIMRRVLQRDPANSARYHFPPGLAALRHQIARRAATYGCNLDPAEVVITSGGMEAVNLALRAVAAPQDVVAVESPTFFGLLQSVEAAGMRVIEVPVHHSTGVDIDRLRAAVTKYRIKTCIVQSNCHNPVGSTMPDESKQRLAELAASKGITIIEDDPFGDLAYSDRRPRPIKAFDRKGIVILCGSFSKSIAPGLRIGWVHAGAHRRALERLKFLTNVAASTPGQTVIAEFMRAGLYDRHLRRLRRALARQTGQMYDAVSASFPAGTRVSRPTGGYALWVETPGLDAMKLYRAALAAGVAILPGPVFSATGGFRHHIRISTGHEWSSELEKAVTTLGKLAHAIRTAAHNR